MRLSRLMVWAGPLLLSSATAHAEPTKDQCIASNESGQDLRRSSRLREASERFSLCTSTSCPVPVREDCIRRLDEARRATPSITLVARDSRGAPIPEVALTVDGSPRGRVRPGEEIDLDPGEHELTLSAAGYSALSKRITVAAGTKGREERAVFETTAGVAPSKPTSASPPTSVFGENQRGIGYGVGGLGGTAIVVGSVLGLVAKSTYDDARAQCGASSTSCTQAGVDGGSTADGQALGSTVFVFVGAALVVAGIALFLTAPDRSAARSGSSGVAWSGPR